MIENSSREFIQAQSLNSSKVQSMTHSLIPNTSRAQLVQIKNDFAIQYPCQPRESGSSDQLPFENDFRDAQLIESLSHRSNSDRIKSHIILTERKKITSPSLKKKRKFKQSLVEKFIQKMKISNNAFIKNQFVQALILDKGINSSSWLKIKKQQLCSLNKINFPLSRYGLFRKIWKCLMKLVYVTILIFSSLMLLYPQREVFQQILLMQLIIIIINTMLNLHTCYYHNDVEIHSLKRIQLHYLKKYGFNDFLLYVSIILTLQLDDISQECRTFPIILMNIVVVNQIKFSCFFGHQGIVGLLRGILQGIFYCHLITIIQMSRENPDIIYESIQQQCQVYLHFFHNYLLQYFSIMADLQYNSNIDLIIAIIIQSLFVINKLGLFYEIQFCFKLNTRNFIVKKNYQNFKTYLQNHKVGSQLLKKALHNYKFEMKQEIAQQNFMFDSQSMKYINYDIQQQIERIVKTKYFKQAKVFEQFSLNIQEKLIDKMQFLEVGPNELVLNYDQRDDMSIYFIKSGQIKLCYHSNNKSQIPMKILMDWETFGEVSFFSGLARTCSAITIGPAQLYKIKRYDLLNAIKSSSQDLETVCYIKDSIIFNNNYSVIALKCLCCNSSEHLIHSCKYLTYQPNKEKILSQHLFNHYQGRKKIRRGRKRYDNTWDQMFQYNLVGEEFQENNFQDEEDSRLLQELTSNNQNHHSSSTNIQQQGFSRPSFMTSRERVASIEKGSLMLNEHDDDIKESFHDLDQIILRKDVFHQKVQHSNLNVVQQEIIQELDSEDSNSFTDTKVKQDSNQQIQNKSHFYQQNKEGKLQDQFVINAVGLPRSLQNLSHTNNTQEMTKSNRQNRKSASYTNNVNNNDTHHFQGLMPILSNIQIEDKDKNNSEIDSGYFKKTKGRPDDNCNQFCVFTQTSPYNDELEYVFGNFEKGYDFVIFYPHNNPNFVIQKYNKYKSLRVLQKRSKYTISYVLSDKINFNLI